MRGGAAKDHPAGRKEGGEMQRICLAGSAMLPLITVGVSGVMLGMALDALLHEPGGRWYKWLKHVLASAARSAARAATGTARKRRRGMTSGKE